MELDTLQQSWADYDRKLDLSLRLNRRILLAANIGPVRSPLHRLAFLISLGAVAGLLLILILGQFIYLHREEPRFALPAAVLLVWLVAVLASSVRQIVMVSRIDYDQPVTAIQRQLESLRVFRIRFTQWALLTGQLVWWTPCLIVALKAFLNLDAYQLLGPAYLLNNITVSLAIIPLAIWVSRKFAPRIKGSPLMQNLINDLAGYNLSQAARFLRALSEFETETPGA